jgi:hypothetical protein
MFGLNEPQLGTLGSYVYEQNNRSIALQKPYRGLSGNYPVFRHGLVTKQPL